MWSIPYSIAAVVAWFFACTNGVLFFWFLTRKDGIGRIVLLVVFGLLTLFFAVRGTLYLLAVTCVISPEWTRFLLRYSAYIAGSPSIVVLGILRPWEKRV